MHSELSPAQIAALRAAARRPRGTICPISGLSGDAASQLVAALIRKGLAEDACPEAAEAFGTPIALPVITAAGRAALVVRSAA